jgi:hypothetical protein
MRLGNPTADVWADTPAADHQAPAAPKRPTLTTGRSAAEAGVQTGDSSYGANVRHWVKGAGARRTHDPSHGGGT